VKARLGRGLAAAGLLAAAMAGCHDGQPGSTAQAPQPTTSFAFPVPPVTHTWKPDGLTCPTLKGQGAQARGLAGPGTRVRGNDSKNGGLLYCHWGPDDESAPAADLQISTAKRQEAADAAWQAIAGPGLFGDPLPGVGEQAFLGPDTGNQFIVIVRSGNVMLSITLKAPEVDSAVRLQSLHDATVSIATDMLTALVPA
jgi:hypothetical protein